jgi:hypothetical protein
VISAVSVIFSTPFHMQNADLSFATLPQSPQHPCCFCPGNRLLVEPGTLRTVVYPTLRCVLHET